MTGVPNSVSAVDTMAAHFRRINQRLAALERASSSGGGGGAIDWTAGYPTYDPRYVNTVGGDAMEGQLRIEQQASSVPALRLKAATAGVTQAYLDGVDSADQRIGYLNFLTGVGVRLATDGNLPVWLRSGSVDAFVATSAYIESKIAARFLMPDDFWTGGTSYFGVGTVGGMTSNGSFRIGFYGNGWRNPTGWTDAGNNGSHGSTAVELDPVGYILLKAQATAPTAATGALEVARIIPQGVLVGKTTYNTYATVAGTEIWGGAGQNFMTLDTASVNLWMTHIAAADAHAVGFIRFIRTGNVAIGSIVQNSTTGVTYNVTSHGPWKGDVRDVTDDEAIEQIMALRPVRFRWKFNPKGVQHEDGTPWGDEQHGFIAQELHEVAPYAASVGWGTQAQHDEWVVRHERYALAAEAHAAAVELALASDVEPPPPFTLSDPGEDPFMPGQADPSKLVSDLTAAVQALVRQVRDQAEQITELRALLGA